MFFILHYVHKATQSSVLCQTRVRTSVVDVRHRTAELVAETTWVRNIHGAPAAAAGLSRTTAGVSVQCAGRSARFTAH
jgi:hypothetical protein